MTWGQDIRFKAFRDDEYELGRGPGLFLLFFFFCNFAVAALFFIWKGATRADVRMRRMD